MTSPPGSTPAPRTAILRLAAPLIVSFWMRAVVTFIDTIYASLIGDPAVAAIGLTVPFEFLMIAIWVGLSTGLTSVLSRAMGAGQHRRIQQYLRSCWRMVAVVAPGFTLIGGAIWLVAPRLDLDPAVAHSFQVYGTVLVAGSAVTTFWSIIPDSLVKAHHDTRSTMWAGIWSNAINVSLNTLFLFVFHWGLFGIALSTVISRIGGLVYALARARAHERRRLAEAAGEDDGPEDPAATRRILALAIPSSLTFGLMALETALINGLLAATTHATEAIASYSIYYRVVLFALQPIIATSVAMLPFAARLLGQQDLAGVRAGLRSALLAAAGYSLLLVGPVMLFGAPWMATALTDSPITRQYTTFALWIVPLSCLAGAPFLLCRPVFEAMHRGTPGLAMAALRYLVLTAPLAWGGLELARWLRQPPLYGLILGLWLAGALSSLAMWLWLRHSLDRSDPPPAGPG